MGKATYLLSFSHIQDKQDMNIHIRKKDNIIKNKNNIETLSCLVLFVLRGKKVKRYEGTKADRMSVLPWQIVPEVRAQSGQREI